MGYVAAKDGVGLFYRDGGPRDAQVIYFHHDWSLSSDDWGAQMLFFFAEGFCVVAHDRHDHDRSSQVWNDHNMDHYAGSVAAVVERLGVRGTIRAGHSTGDGEVVHYIARYPDDPAPRAAIIGAVPPPMVKTKNNPGGLPKSVSDDLQAQPAVNRAQFYQGIPADPFYGCDRPGAQPSEGVVRNWRRRDMMDGAKARYNGIVTFSQTDFSDDLKRVDIPVLMIHGDDGQIVPYENSGVFSAKSLRSGTLKTCPGFPHGTPTTQAKVVNANLLTFIRG